VDVSFIDDYIRAFPRLTCLALTRMIRRERPGVVKHIKFDLEEYICGRREELGYGI